MSARHSPGPWLLEPETDENFACVVIGDSCVYVESGNPADASLIAAAPNLLAAAAAASLCILDMPPTQARTEVAQMLCDAIAKATGSDA